MEEYEKPKGESQEENQPKEETKEEKEYKKKLNSSLKSLVTKNKNYEKLARKLKRAEKSPTVMNYEELKNVFDYAFDEDEESKEAIDYLVYLLKKNMGENSKLNDLAVDYLIDLVDISYTEAARDKIFDISELLDRKKITDIRASFGGKRKATTSGFWKFIERGKIPFNTREKEEFEKMYQVENRPDVIDLMKINQDIKAEKMDIEENENNDIDN